MISEAGRIVALEEDGIWVETVRRSTCGSCGARQGCGHGILNSMASGQRNYTWVTLGDTPAAGFSVGDEVEIALPEEVIVSGSFVVYMLPILATVAGAVVGQSILQADLGLDAAAILGALAGFGVGITVVRWHALRHRNNPLMQPVLVESNKEPVRLV